MKRKTHASFSGNPPVINVKLPSSWQELSQQELLDVYSIISGHPASGAGAISFYLFSYFGQVKVISHDKDSFLCRFKCSDGKKLRKILCSVTPNQLTELLEPLTFVRNPGSVPVRLDLWHKAKAVDAQLHGVKFADYIQIENLYQGFIANIDANTEAFDSLASLLYPGYKPKWRSEVFVLNVLQWMVQVKQMFARIWPNFFKPATSATSTPSMLEVMNNEIRALTGGDVTKEDTIFKTDCWRALTELDFKAKEAEELKCRMSKSK